MQSPVASPPPAGTAGAALSGSPSDRQPSDRTGRCEKDPLRCVQHTDRTPVSLNCARVKISNECTAKGTSIAANVLRGPFERMRTVSHVLWMPDRIGWSTHQRECWRRMPPEEEVSVSDVAVLPIWVSQYAPLKPASRAAKSRISTA